MLRGTKAFRNIEAIVHTTFFLSENKQKITVEKEKRCILNENIDSWFEGKCLSYKLLVSPSTLLFVCLFFFKKFCSRFSVSSQNCFLSGYYLQTAK